ncbi:MAG: DUF6064 family protein [Desulfobacteraceae bacterium]|nr:DUF6064 family protein [Desulfobacteraceae bacterium]
MPFTVEQFFNVFGSYNTAIWPAQLVAYILGIAAVALVFRDTPARGRIVTCILAFSWLWMGVFYHLVHFSRINQAAPIFGAAFVIQGILFVVAGCVLSKLRFRFVPRPIPIVGVVFVLYAMVLYPLIGMIFGHTYTRSPVFGVAPCPSTIFTFGILLWVSRPVPLYLLIIPLLWSLVGVLAAVNLHVPQDYGLGIAGILGTVFLIIRNRELKKEAQIMVSGGA